ncbi:MAG: metal ABC transporter substrate-binding protein [Planctomycetota bacterium]
MPRPLRVLLLAALVLGGCGDPPAPGGTAPRSGPPTVAVTFELLRVVASRLGGDDVRVVAPLPADEDPAWWRPTGEAISVLQQADSVLANGARFERWLDKVNLPRGRLVKTTALIDEPLRKIQDATVHSHGPGGAHSHEGLDGHTFVDPTLLRRQVEAVRRTLGALAPAAAARIDERAKVLDDELASTATRLAALRKPHDGEVIVAAHPVYGYLARRLGWTTIDLDWVEERTPDAAALAELQQQLDGRTARVLLWPWTPARETVQAVEAATGLASVVLPIGDVLLPEDRAAGRDVLAAFRAGVDRLAAALGTE